MKQTTDEWAVIWPGQKIVFGIDPGPKRSALIGLVLPGEGERAVSGPGRVFQRALLPNAEILELLRTLPVDAGQATWAVEWFGCYGMPVGAETFLAVAWAGRFVQLLVDRGAPRVELWQRRTVKRLLLGRPAGKDADVREAVWEAFCCVRASGGCQDTPRALPARPRGSQRPSGPLQGVTRDLWQALGLCLAVRKAMSIGMPPDVVATKNGLDKHFLGA